jgi:hypothetical protein
MGTGNANNRLRKLDQEPLMATLIEALNRYPEILESYSVQILKHLADTLPEAQFSALTQRALSHKNNANYNKRKNDAYPQWRQLEIVLIQLPEYVQHQTARHFLERIQQKGLISTFLAPV